MEKLVSSPLKPPVNPRLQGVFPVLAVEKPVENVENSCGQGCGYIHNFVFMSTDFPYIGRYYCYSFLRFATLFLSLADTTVSPFSTGNGNLSKSGYNNYDNSPN